MTWNNESNGVGSVCRGDRPNRLLVVDVFGKLEVGGCRPVRNLHEGIPYAFLEFGSNGEDWKGEFFSFQREIFVQLLAGLLKDVVVLFNELCVESGFDPAVYGGSHSAISEVEHAELLIEGAKNELSDFCFVVLDVDDVHGEDV